MLVSVAEKRDLGLEYTMVRAKEVGFHPHILAWRILVVNSSQSIQGHYFWWKINQRCLKVFRRAKKQCLSFMAALQWSVPLQVCNLKRCWEKDEHNQEGCRVYTKVTVEVAAEWLQGCIILYQITLEFICLDLNSLLKARAQCSEVNRVVPQSTK